MSKAILVTQELKDKNPDFFNGNTVDSIVIKNIPNVFNGTENINAGGYKLRADLQDLDGWKDVVQPVIGENQKRGFLVLDGDVYTYTVIDLTPEEIQQNLISESESNKQELIQQKLEAQVVEEAQTVTDEEALEQTSLYPMWAGNGISYVLGYKVLDFTADNELALYKVVQAHISQIDWKPKDVPALFTRVQLGDVILDWVQPTGAQDAYELGTKVYYPIGSQSIWISKINANTTVPDGDVPFNRYWEPFIA